MSGFPDYWCLHQRASTVYGFVNILVQIIKKKQCLKRLFVTASGMITPSNFSMLMRSYQISPSTKLVVEGGGIWGIIQQKFSSSIFCRSSSRMNRDIHSLMLPVQPFLCQQPNKAFFMQAVWWEWESRNSYFPSSSRERDSSQGGILRHDRGPHHQAGYQHVRTLLCATEDHHLQFENWKFHLIRNSKIGLQRSCHPVINNQRLKNFKFVCRFLCQWYFFYYKCCQSEKSCLAFLFVQCGFLLTAAVICTPMLSLLSDSSVPLSTCRAQSDSMQENHMLVALGKEDGRGWGVW